MSYDSVHRDELYTDGDEERDVRVALIPLGSDDTGPMIMVLRMGPGFEVQRHSHDTHRCEMVVAGSLLSSDRTLGPGDFMLASPGEQYGPLHAGPEGAITAEFLADRAGFLRIMFEEAVAPDLAEKLEARGATLLEPK